MNPNEVHDYSCTKKTCMRVAFSRSVCILATFAIIGYLTIKLFGNSIINRSHGYVRGNRQHLLHIIKLEFIMLLGSLFMYVRLISYNNSTENEKCIIDLGESFLKISKRRESSDQYYSVILIIWLVLAHMASLLYFIPGVHRYIFNLCLLCFGFWIHLVVILVGLTAASAVIRFLTRFLNLFKFIGSSSNSTCSSVLRFLLSLLTDNQRQIITALTISALLSLATFISSDKIVIKEITIPIRDLPTSAEGFRIALVSDIHAGASVDEETVAKVVDYVNSENADTVFLVGDLTDAPVSRIKDRLTPLAHLRSKYGTFFVTGNHEYYYDNAIEWIHYFSSMGITVLENNHTEVNGLSVVGLNDYSSENSGIHGHHFDVLEALRGCNQTKPVIVLSHNPISAKEIAFNRENLRVDLILSGHTHAGQFYTVAVFMYWLHPYFYGLYTVRPGTTLFVTAGTLYQGPPMKMLRMSEIWLITLKKALEIP
ncbi:hypothetical protein AB6A40_003722 [Gnathostoma spinigerum]|uniref:Calcineurin-like phosphoesterase domain-containing protein n=1 Tax=Gnathostoma spinigerum TaxID=75299 RepID=A0ABD6EAI9_9BILA